METFHSLSISLRYSVFKIVLEQQPDASRAFMAVADGVEAMAMAGEPPDDTTNSNRLRCSGSICAEKLKMDNNSAAMTNGKKTGELF